MLGHHSISERPISSVRSNLPTVSLSTPISGANSNSLTPVLQFIGSDVNLDDLNYNIQISDNVSFAISSLLDSYDETNNDSEDRVSSAYSTKIAQSFDSGAGGILDNVQFYIRRLGTITGNVTAVLYAHSGTYGTSSVATGSAFGTSDTVDASTIPTTIGWFKFNFSGGQRYNMSASTKYVISIEYSGGDGSNRVNLGQDTTTPTHGGNNCYYNGTVWTASSVVDTCFKVDIQSGTVIDKVSTVDVGFSDITNVADTFPFASGDTIGYTVQSALTLSTTYYWRSRASDVDGYSVWSLTESFVATAAAVGNRGGMFIGSF